MKQIVIDQCTFFGLNLINTDNQGCTQTGYFNSERNFFGFIQEAIKVMLTKIRPQALNIVESFKLPDHMLQTAIGNSYGDIYETHLAWAKDSALNKTSNGDAIPEGFMEYIMPMLQHDRLDAKL